MIATRCDFAGWMTEELNEDAYILVANDRFSKNPTTKVLSNTTSNTAIKFMQILLMKNGVPRRVWCDQAQIFRAFRASNCMAKKNMKLFSHQYTIIERQVS